jgi:cell fate regulator YaaT (PSP1 superfamily)
MADIVGVRFKRAGKIYYFDPADIELEVGDYVVVKTARGQELGRVVIAPHPVADGEAPQELKPVVRKAETEDLEQAEALEAKEAKAMAECSRLIDRFRLPMKLLSAEYSLDGTRLTFFFSATERVDFRELVRELNSRFKLRVELRQLGPRDEAKVVGGFGRCGRPLCCVNFLSEFSPVSIRMAKDQDLPLNPMKISGVCGRLLCCLAYESGQYQSLRKQMPKVGTQVSTAMGPAKVVGGNTLKETVLVEMEGQGNMEIPLAEITAIEKPAKEG